jgi:hypothetical protein
MMPGSVMLGERVSAMPEEAKSGSEENPKFWYWRSREDIPYAERAILPGGRKILYVLSAKGFFTAIPAGDYFVREGVSRNPNSGINWFEMPTRFKPVEKYMREDRREIAGLAGLDLAGGDELYVAEKLPGQVIRIGGTDISDIFTTRKEAFERELATERREKARRLGFESDTKVTSPVKVHIGEEGGLIFSYVSHGMDFDFCWTCCSGRKLAVRTSLAQISGILRASVHQAERYLEARFRGRAVGITEARRLVSKLLRRDNCYLSTLFNRDAYDAGEREERFRVMSEALNLGPPLDLVVRRAPLLD